MEKIHVFNVIVSLVSPSRLAGETQIKRILGISHIPAAMKPLLRQSVLPLSALNPLNKQRGRARTLLLKHASRSDFFGWVINPGEQQTILEELDAIKAKFYEEKDYLLQNYHKIKEDHLEELRKSCEKEGFEHTEDFIKVVRDAQPSATYLDEQIKFEYLNPKTIELVPAEATIIREGLLGNALHEIAKRAEQAIEAEAPKAKIKALDEIAHKVNGLGYIAPPLSRIADEIRNIMKGVPRGIRNVDYTPVHVLALSQMLMRLADEERFSVAVKNHDTLFNIVPPAPEQDLLQPVDNDSQSEQETTLSISETSGETEESKIDSVEEEEMAVW